MISILLTMFTVPYVVQSASIVPIESSSSVKVNANGNEYAYSIHENKGVAVETLPVVPLVETPFIRAQPHQFFIKTLQANKDNANMGQEKMEQGELKMDGAGAGQSLKPEQEKDQLPPKKLEKPLEQLFLYGNRLVPTADIQLLEYPYYSPYLYGYAYHYPYFRLY